MPKRLSRLFGRKPRAESDEAAAAAGDGTDLAGPAGGQGDAPGPPRDGIGILEFPNDCGGPAAGVDIIFVHGLRGSRVKTWSSGDVFWPKALLADDLQDARIITWGYDADVANAFSYASSASLFGHAGTFLNDLARVRRGITRPIIFVCHSLGGLVVKEALITSDNYRNHNRHPSLGQIYASTVGVVFLGTPHGGSGKETYGDILAKVAKLGLRQPNTQLLETLRKDSHLLEKQRNDFTTISDEMSVVCVREEIPTAIGTIVPEASAIYQGFNVVPGSIHANHTDMARFPSKEDEGYKRTKGFIEAVCDAKRRELEADNKRTEARNQEILDALRFPGMDSRERGIDEAYAKTCSWILPDELEVDESAEESCRFLTWLRDSDDPFFWISGKAGCGKSTVMKHVYHSERTATELEQSQWGVGKTLLRAAYFFHDRGSNDQKSREGMARSLLHQVLTDNRHLIRRAFPKWDFFAENFPIDSAGKFLMPKAFFEWASLSEAFLSTLHHLNDTKICLFLDGLDEYRMAGREKEYTEQELDLIFDGENEDEGWGRSKWITDGHREIARFLRRLRPLQNVKVCVAGRELNVFEDEFLGFTRIRVHDFTAGAIAEYCTSRLANEAPRLENRLDFASAITGKSRGVFLWVRIVIDMLVQGHTDGSYKDELWNMVDRCPERLGGKDGLYMRMMASINVAYLEESKRLFQILIRLDHLRGDAGDDYFPEEFDLDIITLFGAAERHLQIGSEAVLSVQNDKFNPKTWDELEPRWMDLSRRLKSRCGGLVEGTKKVEFMHQTAKQFMSRKYLWDKTFCNVRGFAIDDEVDLALQSGLVRRLKCCAEAIPRGDFESRLTAPSVTSSRSIKSSPSLTRDGTSDDGKTNTETDPSPRSSYDDGQGWRNVTLLLEAITSIARRERDARCPAFRHCCRKLLDELDTVGRQLVGEATGNKDDADWVTFYLASEFISNDGLRGQKRSFLDVAIFFDLEMYVAAKVIESGLRKEQLVPLLAKAVHLKRMAWGGDTAPFELGANQRLFTIRMLLRIGADPNEQEVESSLSLLEPDTPWTTWSGLLEAAVVVLNYRLNFSFCHVSPSLIKLFIDHGVDPKVQWVSTDVTGRRQSVTPLVKIDQTLFLITSGKIKLHSYGDLADIRSLLAKAEERIKRLRE